jgi:poly(hydroxyalkanoate) granule-associated protein
MRSPLPESGKCNLSARPSNELRGGGIQPAGEQRTGGTMARKTGTSGTRDDDAAKAFADSAQRIWLAGLGAFERARSEGPRMFDALVEQGKTLGGRAREAADQALRNVRESAGSATQGFDRLEQVFEDRVSRSLGRLGVLTRAEVDDLSRQVRDLTDEVRSMMERSSRTASGTAKRAAKRAAPARRRTRKAKGKRRATRA